MKKENTTKRITTLIVVFPLIVLLIYGLLSHIFFFYSQNNEVKKELIMYEKTLMDAQRDTLREKVENLVQFIRYYDGRSSEKIKEDVKNIVNVTADIANNLYREHHKTMSEDKLKEIIKSALRKIKFEGDIGYLFLLGLDGIAHIHIDPKIEGTNILDIQDVKGKYILKEFNQILKEKGEGFVDYYWYIVSEDRKEMHYKISFVKMLDCYDWYIGAGEYLKYMRKFVKRDILDYIKDNAYFKHGYFFISNSKKEIVFHPLSKSKQEIKRCRNKGFSKDDKYLSYTQYVSEYDWYLTANKSLVEIRASIENKKQSSQIKGRANMQTNLYILMFTWLVSILLSLYLSMIINSKLKSYERRLHEANERLIFQSRQALIGELFSMIAHQWRQPINKVASILALLRYKLPKKEITHEEVDKKCQDIEDSVEFMSETIDDFRTFYLPKESSQNVDLQELIERAIYFLEGSIRKKDVKIVKELEHIEYKLYTNEFLQVMINLIKNAMDSIKEDGVIGIKLYKERDKIVISVDDNGVGIDKENISKVFDPYYTTKEDSMGLGLYMTKMIIQKHLKGEIKVERLSKGSRFTIFLYEISK
jgi:signal transduction histidine kinase